MIVPMDTAPLARHLATLSGQQLGALLTRRPDVLRGAAVVDLDDLAARLVHPASVAPALVGAVLPELQVLEVLSAAGAGASIERAAALLDAGHGPEATRSAVRQVVDRLREACLVWPAGAADGADGTAGGTRGPGDAPASDDAQDPADDLRLQVNPGVLDLLPDPLGLGRPAGRLLADVSADALRAVLRRWGVTPPTRKAAMAATVLRRLAEPGHVRSVLGTAPPAVARTLTELAQAAAAVGYTSVPSDDQLADDGPRGRRGAGPGGVGNELDPFDDEEDEPPWVHDREATARHHAAARWALDNGLAFGSAWAVWQVQMPAEVALALQPAGYRLPLAIEPPGVIVVPAYAPHVASGAAAGLTETVAAVMAVLERVERSPLALLRSGGVGAREITRVAKQAGADTAVVRLALECAWAAGLVERVSVDRVGLGAAFSSWRRRSPGERATSLILAWHPLAFVPTVDRDADGRAVPLFTRQLDRPVVHMLREVLLRSATDAPDRGAVELAGAVALGSWLHPLEMAGRVDDAARRTWEELHRWGLLADGAASPLGMALAADDLDALTAEAGRALPAVQSGVLVGSDLTVVVPGTPDPDVVDLLDAMADREGRGGASTWRLSPVSVRRALDAGYDPDDLRAHLTRAAGGTLPQPVDYLLRDVARRYGHVGVRPAAAILVGDDVALLAELTAHRSLRRLGLAAVAPTVLTATAPPAEVLTALRDAGYLPRELDGTGAPVRQQRLAAAPGAAGASSPAGAAGTPGTEGRACEDDGPEPAAQAPAGSWVAGSQAGGPDRPDHLWETPTQAADRLLRGGIPPESDEVTDLAVRIAAVAGHLGLGEVRTLARAVVDGRSVVIDYVSASGGSTTREVSDLDLQGAYLSGWCHLRNAERVFTLARIRSVRAGR